MVISALLAKTLGLDAKHPDVSAVCALFAKVPVLTVNVMAISALLRRFLFWALII